MVLRGFLVPGRGKAEQVRVFSKDKTFVASIDDVAAERHFYSELSTDGTKTLDDLITDYEEIFKTKYFSLRDLPFGTEADRTLAAEVVAHLTIRNAYLRRRISGGMRSLMDSAADLFCNEENLRLIMGVDALTGDTQVTGERHNNHEDASGYETAIRQL